MPMFFEHIDKFCDVIFVAEHPAVSSLRWIYLALDSQQWCFGFHRSSLHLVVITKVILLLVQVDLVNPLAN